MRLWIDTPFRFTRFQDFAWATLTRGRSFTITAPFENGRLENRRRHYFCVDPAFLQERLTSGIYWTVTKALDHDDGVNFARRYSR